MTMRGLADSARYAKLCRHVGEVQFDVLEVGNRLRQSGNTDIIGKRQNLPLPIGSAKEIDEILNIDFRLVKCDSELSLGAKVLFILRVVGNVGNLTQCPADCYNHIPSFRNRTRQRTGFFFRNKFCDVVTDAQTCKICTINDWKTRRHKTLDLKIRPERPRGDIQNIVANSLFRQFHERTFL